MFGDKTIPRRRARSPRTRRGSSISRRACASPAARRSSGSSRRRCANVPIDEVRRARPRAGAEQSRRDREPHRLSRAALRQATSTSSSPTSTATGRKSRRAAPRPPRCRTGISRDVSAGGDGNPRCRPRRTTAAIRRTTIRLGDTTLAELPQGPAAADHSRREQKPWFLDALRDSRATWKVWGNSPARSTGAPIRRTFRRVCSEAVARRGLRRLRRRRSTAPRTSSARRSTTSSRDQRITGFVTVAGDRHSFWAGLAAKALPPQTFEPVGVAFITGSISAPGLVEAFEHSFPEGSSAARAVLRRAAGRREAGAGRQHAAASRRALVPRVCRRRGDAAKARALSNPDLSPHLYSSTWAATATPSCAPAADRIDTEFVCIPRPLERLRHPTAARCATASTHREALETRRKTYARTARPRRRPRPFASSATTWRRAPQLTSWTSIG